MAGRGPRKRTRGEIEQLPSGALRVRVYAGQDPLSGKRHYLSQTVPAGPGAAKVAEQVRTKFLAQVDERRNPITKATMNDLFDQWLTVAELQPSTRAGYESKLDTHIRPAIGGIQVARLDVQTLEALYAALRRCRARCSGRVRTQHHKRGKHTCDKRCVVHECRPLAAATVRQMHSMIQAALGRAVRWQWVPVNVAERAVAPTAPAPNPQPPTAAEAARILAEAWKDPDWGTLVWLAMATGMRRGEICALRWRHVDLDQRVLIVRASIGQVDRHTWEKDTKTHQQRRIALDDHSVGVLRAHLDRCTADAAAVDVELGPDAFVFSRDPDSRTWLRPDSVGGRYAAMCTRIGIKSHLHQLRHYSATELISAGVDVAQSPDAWDTAGEGSRRCGCTAPGARRSTSAPPRPLVPACRRRLLNALTHDRTAVTRRWTRRKTPAHTGGLPPTCGRQSASGR